MRSCLLLIPIHLLFLKPRMWMMTTMTTQKMEMKGTKTRRAQPKLKVRQPDRKGLLLRNANQTNNGTIAANANRVMARPRKNVPDRMMEGTTDAINNAMIAAINSHVETVTSAARIDLKMMDSVTGTNSNAGTVTSNVTKDRIATNNEIRIAINSNVVIVINVANRTASRSANNTTSMRS